MKPTPLTFLFLLVMSLALFSCHSDTNPPVAKGNRQVAIHITQAELNSYDTEFQRAKNTGMQVVPITLPWTFIENNGKFDFSLVDIINSYYPPTGVKVSLNITPIYAVSLALPSDIQTLALNDQIVINRFHRLLDSVKKHLPNALINNFVVGLEVDNYLNNHSSQWTAYKSFYDSARTYIKKQWGSSMPVGVETTWISATIASKNQIIDLNEHSDMMVLSYYPENTDFTVRPPTDVHSDIETLMSYYPSMPIFIIECGYQTSADCNSSDAKQQQFIHEMFSLWDAHPTRINFMGFLWLTDLSSAQVDKLVSDYQASGLPSLNAFRGYLQTTGLRTYSGNGTDKAGFTQLKTELQSRGW